MFVAVASSKWLWQVAASYRPECPALGSCLSSLLSLVSSLVLIDEGREGGRWLNFHCLLVSSSSFCSLV